jgi:hypothetical protein
VFIAVKTRPKAHCSRLGARIYGRRNQRSLLPRNRTTVANLKAPGTPGFTRLNWDLRPTKDVRVEYGGEKPERFLAAGDYTAS